MDDSISQDVPRTPDEPTASDILDEMSPCTPYTTADFIDRYDVSRWTIRRRLQELHDEGHIQRRKHSGNVLTYWIDIEDEEQNNGGDNND